jgi:predicted nuclease of predicted toxin-antitoxin system
MKVLIDENLSRKLAAYLPGHECRTVTECGWAGKKNGELLALAEPLFEVPMTLDKNVPYQQNLVLRRISILIVRARSNRIQDLPPLVSGCLATLEHIGPGEVIRVGSIRQVRKLQGPPLLPRRRRDRHP